MNQIFFILIFIFIILSSPGYTCFEKIEMGPFLSIKCRKCQHLMDISKNMIKNLVFLFPSFFESKINDLNIKLKVVKK